MMATEKGEQRQYRYFDLMLGLFVAILIISNIVSVKAVTIPLPFTKIHFSLQLLYQ